MRNGFTIAERFDPHARAVVFEGDCRELLRQVPSGAIQLVVTSPPYNLGKEYESRLDLDEYLSQQREVITECVRVLSGGGSICWQVGNYVDDGAIIPLDSLLYPIFAGLGLDMRNRIVWHFEHGLHCSRRLSGRYETILWFTKGEDYFFELDAIRVPQKYPGKKYFKGPKAGQYSCNPLGKNPGDVWTIPNVKSNHVEKTGHPCQFPVELIERLVLALSRKGDWVLDPFLGTGTSIIAAVLHERRGIGAEVIRKYAETARSRILMAAHGTLPIRPMDRPVFDPKDAGRNLITAPWLADQQPVDQMALLEKAPPYRTRK
jgi:adenine-specific DNA-methyltransferase